MHIHDRINAWGNAWVNNEDPTRHPNRLERLGLAVYFKLCHWQDDGETGYTLTCSYPGQPDSNLVTRAKNSLKLALTNLLIGPWKEY